MAATPPTLAEFLVLYPQFVDPPVPTVVAQSFLDDNIAGFDEGQWGNCYKKSVYLMTAHELTLWLQEQQSAAEGGGVVTQVGVLQSGHEEGIAFAFARRQITSAADEWFSLTPYGLGWMALQRRCIGRRAALSW